MKRFIFTDTKNCINPNRTEIGNDKFWLEIMTAMSDGKWYSGYRQWSNGKTFDMDVYINGEGHDTEREAILLEIEHLLKYFALVKERRYEPVPDFVFDELKNLRSSQMATQLSLF